MGNEQSVVKNVDKRTARREQALHFIPAICAFRMEHSDGKPVGVVSAIGEDDHRSEQSGGGGMRVCVRKRPIFPHELKQGEYDVVTCLLQRGAAKIVVHDARMHSDMRHMFINHNTFSFDAVFGEAASNRQVYLEAAAPLVGRAVHDGVTATIMMYGQTGSGKTYTMSAIYELVSVDLFDAISDASGSSPVVSVCFVELAGEHRCADMLNRGNQVQLLTGRDGAVHPYPLAEVTVNSADELLCFIRLACALRATEATGVHSQSSRSHAVCRIFIDHGNGQEGMIQLIDLAGSEHRIDSAEHDAARRKEGAQINSSLAALKECVRCKAAGKVGGTATFLPYRKSKLTHLLRACFEDGNPTVVIATVSPASKDTEHSLNTIRHACIMDGQGTGALDPPGGVSICPFVVVKQGN